jgi:hypothetical protein
MRARITITIPQDLVQQADARAEQLGRSRSWVLVEALRYYLRTPPQVSEPVVTYRTGLGLSRQLQLESDLELSAEQRVKEAQRTALAVPQGVRRARDQIVTFDSYRHYVEWKRKQDVR